MTKSQILAEVRRILRSAVERMVENLKDDEPSEQADAEKWDVGE